MPWEAVTVMSQRLEMVQRANQEGANISALCREYGVSRKTGYKWLKRYRQQGEKGLQDQSRRPHHSPKQTDPEVEQLIIRAREAHPAWGGRKLHHFLRQRGYADIPSASTITAILQRHGYIDPDEAVKQRPYRRFERTVPNALWQMDYKGDVHLRDGSTCYPLTVIDDYSRYVVAARACLDHRGDTLQPILTRCFESYGLPEAMRMDNGVPWGHRPQQPMAVKLREKALI